EAVAVWQQKLALEREVLGPHHAEVINSLGQLAAWQEEREEWAAARQARQEVLKLQTQRYGPANWRVTDARLDLDHLERLARLDADSRQRLRQATALNRQIVRLRQQGRAREALPLARQALDLRKAILSEDHPDYATSLNSLAALYRD